LDPPDTLEQQDLPNGLSGRTRGRREHQGSGQRQAREWTTQGGSTPETPF
jgi:hypothetical protein